MENPNSAEARFGARVRIERERRGWSQSDLADRVGSLGIAMHPATIAKIEARDSKKPRNIRLDEAHALAEIFNISIESMIGTVRNYDMSAIVSEFYSTCYSLDREISHAMIQLSNLNKRMNFEADALAVSTERAPLEAMVLKSKFYRLDALTRQTVELLEDVQSVKRLDSDELADRAIIAIADAGAKRHDDAEA
ncbi:helix-turn-helix transcriptional regulator [Rhodococcus erythropolis]|uniref:helix-turn-helix transcriptional regulator n=1 Tax=Rhodococcus erythropolis TaxID=1833 RepID=UPI001BEB156E|nr:helix-turn-helix transcriptional regulator [Rhodococcus erythropolis]MBT2266293.1 helix-turn-helix transcriptional regulator [Rhodococcus erythropolis]